jgi:prephenate dehydratase
MKRTPKDIPTGPVVLFQGLRGTSDERAARLLVTVSDPDVHPVPSIETLLRTVDLTPECMGLLPVENPLEGELAPVMDRIAFETTNIYVRETVVLMEQLEAFSVSKTGHPRVAVSHPFVLALCERSISRAGLSSMTSLSTTEACKTVANSKDDGLVAIAPSEVGATMGLYPRPEVGTGLPEVRTRYALISREVAPVTGNDQTLIVVTPEADRPGSLAGMLSILAARSINLTSLRSRPILVDQDTRPGKTTAHSGRIHPGKAAPSSSQNTIHCFFIELTGHIFDPTIQSALTDIMSDGARIRVLGSYPKWPGTPVDSPFEATPLGSVDMQSTQDEIDNALNPPIATADRVAASRHKAARQ